MSLSLIPDWESNQIAALVWPSRRRELEPLYAELMAALPCAPLLLFRGAAAARPGDSQALYPVGGGDPRRLTLESLHDIGVRDWAPFLARDEKGALVAIKARYRPKGPHELEALGDDLAGHALPTQLGWPRLDLSLTWEGRNLTHNGRGLALCTRRLLRDNPFLREGDLRQMLYELLGLSQIVLVEEGPNNPRGHITPFARFLAPDLLTVADFPSSDFEHKTHADTVARLARSGFAPSVRVLRVPCQAASHALSFLRVGDNIYFPYGGEEDEDAMFALLEALPGITLCKINTATLARYGRALDGLAITLPQEYLCRK